MSEALEPAIEEEPTKDNEEAIEQVEDVKPEEFKKEEPKEEQKEEAPKEDEQFKNKTDRMKNKKVKCEGCQAEMTLKTLRYSHKCNGKTEDKPIKPKPKTRAVAVKPVENQVIKTIPPTRVKEQKQEEAPQPKQQPKPVRMIEPEHEVSCSIREPPRQPTARELLASSYAEIRRAKQQEQMEKIARFKTSMF